MATTQEILDAAGELGTLVNSHAVAVKFEESVKALREDVEAQRTLTDYQRHLTALAEKNATGKPIEVDDKQKLETLQNKVIQTPVLRDFQMAQMDYLDLMRQVDAAITGPSDAAPGAASSPIVNPDVSETGGQ